MGVGIEGTFQSERRQEETRYQFRRTGMEFVEETTRTVEALRRRATIPG